MRRCRRICRTDATDKYFRNRAAYVLLWHYKILIGYIQLLIVHVILVIERWTSLDRKPIFSPKDFGNQVKQTRKEKGITQKQLAEKVGVTQQTISAVEKGILDPSLKLLLVLAGILGLALLLDVLRKE